MKQKPKKTNKANHKNKTQNLVSLTHFNHPSFNLQIAIKHFLSRDTVRSYRDVSVRKNDTGNSEMELPALCHTHPNTVAFASHSCLFMG